MNGRRELLLQFLDSSLKRSNTSLLFRYSHSGKLAIDTKRNELYIVAQLSRKAFSKDSLPKLPFAIVVKKTTLAGGAIGGGKVVVKAGETRITDSSLSCFYDIARDRFVLNNFFSRFSAFNASQMQLLLSD